MKSNILPQIAWHLVLLSGLLLCLYLSFQINSFANYHFDFFYDYYRIESHIQEFAPQNQFKQGFELLNRQEHIRLFEQIVDAIHQRGGTLNDIVYPLYEKNIPLLTQAEVTHLLDVKNLIHWIHVFAMFLLPVFALLLIFLLHYQNHLNWKLQISLFCINGICITLLLALIGSKAVFYTLHEWIFPDNHQWFFYYQESLMSTLMKAPTLFAGIAWLVLGLGLILFAILFGFILSLQKAHRQHLIKPLRFRIRLRRRKRKHKQQK